MGILEGSIDDGVTTGGRVVGRDRLDWPSMEGGDRLRSRLASMRCAGCGRAYGDGHVRIRAERGAVSFVDLICRACGCQASAIATIVADGDWRPRIELGDLEEASSVHVEIDDVLEMSSFLTTFDGDFRRHFGDDGVIDGSTPA
jgi:hypothetical protein